MNNEQKQKIANFLSPVVAIATWALGYFVFIGPIDRPVEPDEVSSIYFFGGIGLFPAWLASVWVRGFFTEKK